MVTRGHCRHERLTAPPIAFVAIAHASKVYSPKLSGGRTPLSQVISFGVPSLRRTSPPGTAEARNSRIVDRSNPTHARIFSWLICESYDDKGNVIVYSYKREDAENVDLESQHMNAIVFRPPIAISSISAMAITTHICPCWRLINRGRSRLVTTTGTSRSYLTMESTTSAIPHHKRPAHGDLGQIHSRLTARRLKCVPNACASEC